MCMPLDPGSEYESLNPGSTETCLALGAQGWVQNWVRLVALETEPTGAGLEAVSTVRGCYCRGPVPGYGYGPSLASPRR